jgi:hypothetical protein
MTDHKTAVESETIEDVTQFWIRMRSRIAPPSPSTPVSSEREEDNHTMYGIGFDVESSGNNVVENGIIELGASLIDLKTNEVTLEFDSQPFALSKGKTWNEDTLKWWKADPARAKRYHEEFATTTRTGAEAASRFAEFLQHVKETYNVKRIVPITDTTAFDPSMLNAFFAEHKMPSIQHMFGMFKDVISTDSYFQAVANVSVAERLEIERCKIFSADEAVKKWWHKLESLGYAIGMRVLPWPVNKEAHRAIADAREIAQMFGCVNNRVEIVKAINSTRSAWRAAQSRKLHEKTNGDS